MISLELIFDSAGTICSVGTILSRIRRWRISSGPSCGGHATSASQERGSVWRRRVELVFAAHQGSATPGGPFCFLAPGLSSHSEP